MQVVPAEATQLIRLSNDVLIVLVHLRGEHLTLTSQVSQHLILLIQDFNSPSLPPYLPKFIFDLRLSTGQLSCNLLLLFLVPILLQSQLHLLLLFLQTLQLLPRLDQLLKRNCLGQLTRGRALELF